MVSMVLSSFNKRSITHPHSSQPVFSYMARWFENRWNVSTLIDVITNMNSIWSNSNVDGKDSYLKFSALCVKSAHFFILHLACKTFRREYIMHIIYHMSLTYSFLCKSGVLLQPSHNRYHFTSFPFPFLIFYLHFKVFLAFPVYIVTHFVSYDRTSCQEPYK